MLSFRRISVLVFLLLAQGLSLLARPLEIVLVDPKMATASAISQWKKEGFNAIAVVLDESSSSASLNDLAKRLSSAGLDLYYWIEVARNPDMAAKNPRWMASLGVHQDWQRDFPKFPEPGVGQVAKAYPWVPIGYREAFDAHLARIERLLKRAPEGWRGVLLNDLQGGPSSCGCGNLQCRWALDYQVSSTATKMEGYNVPARFVSEVRSRVGDKTVIPVWTTECSDVDLPPKHHGGQPGTGFCGNVSCAHSACAEVFSAQWSFLASPSTNPVALLATHTSLRRTQPEFGGGPAWFTNAITYINQTLPAHRAVPPAPETLWAVVDGRDPSNETTAREAARAAKISGFVSARIQIDQSYEPKMIKTE